MTVRQPGRSVWLVDVNNVPVNKSTLRLTARSEHASDPSPLPFRADLESRRTESV